MKLRERLELLRRLAPKRSRYGQLYRDRVETEGKPKRITMYTLLESDEGTHMVHEAVFNKQEGKTAKEWAAWFSRNFYNCYRNGVLPGVALRTEKTWRVKRVLGWRGHDKHRVAHPKVPRGRHQTKRQRSAHG
jgi:hypothetical protein